MTFADKFWPRVEKTRSCWLWRGAISSRGYGNLRDGIKAVIVHRWAYEQAKGAVLAKMEATP